jgi:hypothetical protein
MACPLRSWAEQREALLQVGTAEGRVQHEGLLQEERTLPPKSASGWRQAAGLFPWQLPRPCRQRFVLGTPSRPPPHPLMSYSPELHARRCRRAGTRPVVLQGGPGAPHGLPLTPLCRGCRGRVSLCAVRGAEHHQPQAPSQRDGCAALRRCLACLRSAWPSPNTPLPGPPHPCPAPGQSRPPLTS